MPTENSVFPSSASQKPRTGIPYTNATPIIRTHNILTSHNQTHTNPVARTNKSMLYYYGFVTQQVTSQRVLWELCWMIFLRLMPQLEASFFYGFADHILHPVREKAPFWATVEKKTAAWWPQLHKQGLHTNVCLGRLE